MGNKQFPCIPVPSSTCPFPYKMSSRGTYYYQFALNNENCQHHLMPDLVYRFSPLNFLIIAYWQYFENFGPEFKHFVFHICNQNRYMIGPVSGSFSPCMNECRYICLSFVKISITRFPSSRNACIPK